MKTCFLCPSRNRPEMLANMAKSLVETSERAHMLVYIDTDQVQMYLEHCRWKDEFGGRLRFFIGSRIGLARSLETLVKAYDEYDVYSHATDDSVIKSPGWEPYLEATVRALPNGIGAVMPFHDDHHFPGYPTVTREWIKALGWYTLPGTIHWGWDSAIRHLGQQTVIRHMAKEEFYIKHLNADFVTPDDYDLDMATYMTWRENKSHESVARLKERMEAV